MLRILFGLIVVAVAAWYLFDTPYFPKQVVPRQVWEYKAEFHQKKIGELRQRIEAIRSTQAAAARAIERQARPEAAAGGGEAQAYAKKLLDAVKAETVEPPAKKLLDQVGAVGLGTLEEDLRAELAKLTEAERQLAR